jgi:hypothetical protein
MRDDKPRPVWTSPSLPITHTTERCEIWDHVSSNSITPYLRTSKPTSCRQLTAPATKTSIGLSFHRRQGSSPHSRQA